jgi:small subunit ribosomal protein S17
MSQDDKDQETTGQTPAEDEDTAAAAPVAEDTSADEQGSDDAAPAAEGDTPDAADASEAASNSESSPPSEEAPAAEQDSDSPPDPGREAEESGGIDQEPNPEDELPWKERRRLQKSRRPHKAGPALDAEGRKAQRAEARKRKASLRRQQRAAAKAAHTAGTGTPAAERSPNAAKVRQGIVVSDRGEKSITVRIDIARRHPVYEKIVRTSRTLRAHDERNEAGEGDVVRVVETRPLSKTKRWRLVEVIEKAK